MEKLVNLESYPVQVALQLLLADKTSEKNIVFATGTYDGIDPHDHMTEDLLRKIDLQPRVEKTSEEQSLRTKKKAEVFTPSWVVNQMNNYCDENWFGRKNVFNVEDKEDHTWNYVADTIEMPSGKTWQDYVLLLKMEITCGEAPFIVSRYDPATGRRISVGNRIGVLDRKLRIVGEHTQNESEWRKWATAALKSSYGYEFQGDNLLIARVNILDTLCEYRDNRFGGRTDNNQIKNWAEIIAWNFWQMDGFSGCIPFGKVREPVQTSFWQDPSEIEAPVVDTECKIRDWRNDEVITYNSMKEGN